MSRWRARATTCRGPFHVLATQNPLEQEGTYPLPEAQLDRFLLQIDVGYPDLDAERRMLLATTMGEEESAGAGLRPRRSDGSANAWCAAFRWARQVMDAILKPGARRAARFRS